MQVSYNKNSLITGKEYPVLYYTDSWYVAELFNLMEDFVSYDEAFDQVILVGISCDANEDLWVKLRETDYVPNPDNLDTASGAKDFLNFIKYELIPYVEKNYPADSSGRGLFGDSYGGLFAMWVLREDSWSVTIFMILAITGTIR